MEIPEKLAAALASGDLIIFLGAGFGIDSGFPLWPKALQEIATELEKHSPPHAGLMRIEAHNGRFLEAADLLYSAPLTHDVRREILQAVFGKDPRVSGRQKRLLQTPCQGFVTTNYDRSIEIAKTQARIDLHTFTETETDLANARVCMRQFYVRLNGRIEAPEGIVFARRQYDELPRRTGYVEFFREMFVNRNILFFGFSFVDPFLRETISTMSKAVHSVFQRSAFALFSNNPDAITAQFLNDAGIVPVIYDQADSHAEAWNIFGPRTIATIAPSDDTQLQRVRSEIAAVYARARARDYAADRVQVLSGLLMPVLQKIGTGGTVRMDEFEEQARNLLALPNSFPRDLIIDAAKRLEQDHVVRLSGSGLEVLHLPGTDVFGKDLNKLVNGLISRARVRYQVPAAALSRPILSELVLATLIIDGLHVAHSMIRGQPLSQGRLTDAIKRACKVARVNDSDGPLVAKALEHLFTHPDAEEEKLLAALASLAFSTSLLVADPSLVASKSMSLPGAFFDTNVLLPWLCYGHPVQPLSESLVSLFAKCGGAYVIPEYLNEIVSHRKLAVDAVRDGDLGDPIKLRRFVSLFEAHGINAFLGGYAGVLATGVAFTFDEYLQKHAPYEDESQAAVFLEEQGIVVYQGTHDPYSIPGGPLFGQLKAELYERRRREEIRVRHDARQLEILLGHKPVWDCPYFVTADKTLISAMAATSAARLLPRVVLPHQAAYIGELLGAGTVLTGLTRAMWMSAPDLHKRIQDYYIDRVLSEYEFALVSELPDIVDTIIADIERTNGDLRRLDLDEDMDDRKLRVFTAMDRFEPRFYEKLLRAKREAGL
jgi:hypothetical protein